ncbi:MAG: tetratricopeptide repeat protein [Pseudanabaenaceae cyanobacterium]
MLAICLFLLLSLPSFASVAELRQQGLEYRRQGRWAEALAVLQRSVALAPQDVTGYVMLGWTQHLAKRSGAAATLWRALRLDMWAVEAANALGIVYLTGGQLQPAVLVHSWAAVIKPANEIAHYNLCLAYQRLDLADWAIAHGERAMELEPYNPHPIVAVAVVYWAQGERERALQLYHSAVALDGEYGNADYLNHLGEAGFSQAQIDIAETMRRQLFP